MLAETRSSFDPKRFWLGVVASASLVVGAGWLTGVRTAFHSGVLLAVGVALFPLLLVCALLLLSLGAMLIMAVAGGDASSDGAGPVEGIVEGGTWLGRRYYGLLWGQRRAPLAVGTAAGILAGIALLGALSFWVVIPKERVTVEVLLETQQRIEDLRSEGALPGRTPDGRLDARTLPRPSMPGSSPELVLDGFGRPLLLEIRGSGRSASYELRSLGFDGKRGGGDDLCIVGKSKWGAWLERLKQPLELVRALRGGAIDKSEEANLIRGARCRDALGI